MTTTKTFTDAIGRYAEALGTYKNAAATAFDGGEAGLQSRDEGHQAGHHAGGGPEAGPGEHQLPEAGEPRTGHGAHVGSVTPCPRRQIR